MFEHHLVHLHSESTNSVLEESNDLQRFVPILFLSFYWQLSFSGYSFVEWFELALGKIDVGKLVCRFQNPTQNGSCRYDGLGHRNQKSLIFDNPVQCQVHVDKVPNQVKGQHGVEVLEKTLVFILAFFFIRGKVACCQGILHQGDWVLNLELVDDFGIVCLDCGAIDNQSKEFVEQKLIDKFDDRKVLILNGYLQVFVGADSAFNQTSQSLRF